MQTEKLEQGNTLSRKIVEAKKLVDNLELMSVITFNAQGPTNEPNPLVIRMFRRNAHAAEVYLHDLFPIDPEIVLSLSLQAAKSKLYKLQAEFDNL